MIVWAFNSIDLCMDIYNKINDELGDMWMYCCLIFVARWGCELIYWN
jgi:hypothetical protein